MDSFISTDEDTASNAVAAGQFNGLLSAGGILDRIVEKKAGRLRKAQLTANQVRKTVSGESPLVGSPDSSVNSEFHPGKPSSGPSFADAIGRSDRINVVAEIKRQSPSKGVIRESFDPVAIAESYSRNGAAALSVLTEEDFFGGSLAYLAQIREQIPGLPLLRKDFIFDEYQIRESKQARADALLLITAILNDELLARLIALTCDEGLDPLVEVHSGTELDRALRAGARMIGVNNRDLTDFTVSLMTSLELGRLAPSGTLLVSESGITTGEDIALLRRAGFKAFLVGEHLMRQEYPGASLACLIDAAQRSEHAGSTPAVS